MQSILKRLQTGGPPLDILGLHGASTALLLGRALEALQKTICCILPSDEQLEILAQDIAFFSPVRVLVYPSFEIPPYTPLSPDPATVCTRLATLYRLQDDRSPCLILTSAEAVLRRVLPASALNSRCELIITNEEVDRDKLITNLIRAGYQSSELVRQEGDMALRGGIIDVYPPAIDGHRTGPLRLDFFGDTVDSIRQFDPLTQRSSHHLDEAVLLPASDLLFPMAEQHKAMMATVDQAAADHNWSSHDFLPIRDCFVTERRYPGMEFMLPLFYGGGNRLQSLFDYLPPQAAVIISDPLAVRQKTQLVQERIQANYAESLATKMPALPPDELFLTEEDLQANTAQRLLARLPLLPDLLHPGPALTVATGDHTLLAQEIELQRKKRGLLTPLADRITMWHQHQETVVLACRSARQAQHLQEMLGNYQLRSAPLPLPFDRQAAQDAQVIYCCQQPLSRGFDLLDEQLHFLSAAELFGDKRLQTKRRVARTREEGQPIQIDQLAPGDVVVHRDHGIGVFQGLINMEFSGLRGDFMQIEFRDGDKLYVPMDRLNWVSRYQGLTDQDPKLDSLGSQRWQSTKKKVTDAVWKIAQELLEIYAQRAMRQGHRFSPPGDLYRELEESFAYDETKGQAKAINEVVDDLTSDQPMDRLICGDVGYGKTEVAARAAFKAIEDGYQVAILVPTTVLAEQHAATFRDRFASFPVEIACLNRFRTTRQQKEIAAALSTGSVDLVVGTHRLLSKDIQFNKLGLLIVDEEHRFGVSHKEKIKKIKATVDVLTLTATPIPRTLQMSLLGIRDLSVISTPPQQRRSVKTFLARYDQLVIREAVLRELERGGQLFFVHNRVQSIHRMAETIASLVPQARIGVAHGQMLGPQLEEIMVRFINHELDILVCTTIIESGLDIPNANTIIINRADRLGLADIYQLRGRVGRSSRQAYAYLLVQSLDHLTKDAQQRLRALMDCTELGGGFKLAMNDLQIRGGGNLLGVSQSGHIAAVGYDLYLELLQSTVTDLKKRAASGLEQTGSADIDPEIKLKVAAFFPDRYIPDTSLRYSAYRRLSAASMASGEELADLRDELIDRYGPLPAEAQTLLALIGLKQELRLLGIGKLEQGPEALVFSFAESSPVDPQKIVALVQNRPTGKKPGKPIRLTPDRRLLVPVNPDEDLFVRIQTVVNALKG